MPTIRDGRTTLSVTLLQRPHHAPGPEDPKIPGREFLAWWKRECHLRDLPEPKFTGVDYAVAARLCGRHGQDTLKTLATHYFRRHFAARERATSEILAFAGCIPTIQSEMKTESR